MPAQSAQIRQELAGWDDSVNSAASLDQLRILETAAGRVGDETRGLRRSMVQARVALLKKDVSSIQLALDNLQLDATQHPDWLWPNYLRARFYFDIELDRQIELADNLPAFQRGWISLNKALQADPEYPPVQKLALRTITASGDREFQEDMVATLQRLVQQPFPDPDALLDWGRYLRTQLRYDSAQSYLTRAVFAGGDRSRLGLERARTFMAMGDSAAAVSAYWDGLARLTGPGRDLYRFDLAWIVSPDTIAIFDRLPNDSVTVWLKSFWGRRDAEAAKEEGGRLREHLRRWVVVNAQYRSHQPWRRTQFDRVEFAYDQGWDCLGAEKQIYEELALSRQPLLPGDIRFREYLYDHRGMLYLRHGAPLTRLGNRSSESSVEEGASVTAAYQAEKAGRDFATSESWVYWFGGTWRILHFMGSDALGHYAPTTLKGFLPFNDGAYQELGNYLKEYADVAAAIRRYQNVQGSKGPLACEEQRVQDIVNQSRAEARLAIHTDSDKPPVVDPWRGMVRAFVLGDPADGSGKLLLTWAFAAADLEGKLLPTGVEGYPVDLRVVAMERSSGAQIRIDSSLTYALRGNSASGWFMGRVERPINAGSWQLSVYARQPENEARGTYSQLSLAMDPPGRLRMSDVVTGREGATPWLAPDGQTFPLYPMVTWRKDDVAPLYYELRGIAEDQNYSTSIEIISGKSSKIAMKLEFQGKGTGQVIYARQRLGLKQLDPGDYRMRITVEAKGEKVSREFAVAVDQ